MSEIILFSAEGCSGCDIVKKHLKDPTKIKIVDVTKDEEYARFAFENQIYGVPSVIIKTDKGIEKCDLQLEGGKVKARCKDKEIIL